MAKREALLAVYKWHIFSSGSKENYEGRHLVEKLHYSVDCGLLCCLHHPSSWLTDSLLFTVPLMLPPDGKGLEEGNVRYLVQPRASRTGPGPWQGGRRKFRRQRPRLSHKGPMPF